MPIRQPRDWELKESQITPEGSLSRPPLTIEDDGAGRIDRRGGAVAGGV